MLPILGSIESFVWPSQPWWIPIFQCAVQALLWVSFPPMLHNPMPWFPWMRSGTISVLDRNIRDNQVFCWKSLLLRNRRTCNMSSDGTRVSWGEISWCYGDINWLDRVCKGASSSAWIILSYLNQSISSVWEKMLNNLTHINICRPLQWVNNSTANRHFYLLLYFLSEQHMHVFHLCSHCSVHDLEGLIHHWLSAVSLTQKTGVLIILNGT